MGGKAIAHDLQSLVAKLPESTTGAMFMPMDPSNPCADVFGLFRVAIDAEGPKQFALMVLQCKDWFKEPIDRRGAAVNVIEEWRKAQRLMCSVEKDTVRCVARDSNGAPLRFEFPDAVVDVHYVLFTNNPLSDLSVNAHVGTGTHSDENVSRTGGSLRLVAAPRSSSNGQYTLELGTKESVLNLISMRLWLPTAAFNAELAHRVRRMFRVDNDCVSMP